MLKRVNAGGTEWIQSNAMKLRRGCGCSGVRSRGIMTARGECVRERTARIFMAGVHSLIASCVGCASARKLFFSSAGWGVRSGKGARA